MKYDNFSLIDFMQECVKSYITDLEMENYMRYITKNSDTELIKTLFLDVNKLSGAIIKFIIEKSSIDNGIESTLLVETSLDVYISEKYIYLLTKKMNSEGYDVSDDFQKFKDAFYYLSVLEKLKLLKEINTKINFESIISKYGDLLRFCHLVEREFKKIHSKANSNKSKNNTPKTFDQLFVESGWNKYIDVLTKCNPPLLKKEEDMYTFIGNKKTQKGCVAQWFKYLKITGVINQSTSRDELAMAISSYIENYTIVGSSIDNESEAYKKTFEKQLKDLLSMSQHANYS